MQDELDKTSEKIIKATLVVLKREGFEKATTKKIAAEAGINEITIFRKFDTKANLIEATKDYHLQVLVNKLKEIFDFDEDENIEEFLRIAFFGILNLEENDFSIIRVAMEEVRNVPDEKLLISVITDVIIGKLEEFFGLQVEKGIVKDINIRSISIMCYSTLFQSVILWKVYNKSMGFETNHYVDDLLTIFFEGILVNQ